MWYIYIYFLYTHKLVSKVQRSSRSGDLRIFKLELKTLQFDRDAVLWFRHEIILWFLWFRYAGWSTTMKTGSFPRYFDWTAPLPCVRPCLQFPQPCFLDGRFEGSDVGRGTKAMYLIDDGCTFLQENDRHAQTQTQLLRRILASSSNYNNNYFSCHYYHY